MRQVSADYREFRRTTNHKEEKMKTMKIDLTSIYNDLQSKKIQHGMTAGHNPFQPCYDRLVVHISIAGDTIEVRGFGCSCYPLQPSLYNMGHSVRAMFNGTEPTIILNGKQFPFTPLVDGDSIFANVSMPSFTSFPMPDKCDVQLVSQEVAMGFLKTDSEKQTQAILKDIAISRESVAAATNGHNMIIGIEDAKPGITLLTAAAIVRDIAGDYAYGKADANGVINRNRDVLKITLVQGVLQQSGNSKVLTVYPGTGGWGHATKKVFDDGESGDTSVFQVVPGRPACCVE